jgi:Cu+-exporting ATPase
LIDFLLSLGRCLESYGKTRAADAITALTSLRPARALLLVPRDPVAIKPIFRSSEHDIEKGEEEEDDDDDIQPALSSFKTKLVDVDVLEVGDVVRVQNGATPPADGVIVSGSAGVAFDESSLTGESRLIKKTVGDKVFLGTINKSKVVDIKITVIGGSSMYVYWRTACLWFDLMGT